VSLPSSRQGSSRPTTKRLTPSSPRLALRLPRFGSPRALLAPARLAPSSHPSHLCSPRALAPARLTPSFPRLSLRSPCPGLPDTLPAPALLALSSRRLVLRPCALPAFALLVPARFTPASRRLTLRPPCSGSPCALLVPARLTPPSHRLSPRRLPSRSPCPGLPDDLPAPTLFALSRVDHVLL
jgi:hypothetical protein